MLRFSLILVACLLAEMGHAATIIAENFDSRADGTILPAVSYTGGTGISELVGSGSPDAQIASGTLGKHLDVNIPSTTGTSNISVGWATSELSFLNLGGGASSAFTLSTDFTIESLTLGSNRSTINLALVAFADNANFSSGANYRLVYSAQSSTATNIGKLSLTQGASTGFVEVFSAETNLVESLIGKSITLNLTGSYSTDGLSLTLSGSMYDGSVVLAEVSATDSVTVISGTNFGVRSAVNGAATTVAENVNFDNFSIRTIPEPWLSPIFAVGGYLLITRFRCQRPAQ